MGPGAGRACRDRPGRQVLVLDLPGHGQSACWQSYDVDSVAEAVHQAVQQARLYSPVVVGHSYSAVVATVYATRYPARGIVNVDQWLQVEPTAELTRSLAALLRGRGFPAAWRMFEASMHIELLPAPAQHLPESTCHPARTWSPATGGNCSTPPYRRRRHAPGPGWRRCAPPRCRTCSSPVTSSNLNTRNG